MDGGNEESIVEEKIELNINHLEDISAFKNEIEKTNKLFIKTVSKVGNILEKNLIYVFVSADGKNIYYINDEELELIKDIISNEEIKKIWLQFKRRLFSFKTI